MLNKVSLIGNIGRPPKIGLTQEGKQMAFFTMATTHSWKNATGEWQSATDWHKVTIFRETTADWIRKTLKKGDLVYVEGKLSYHQWTDKFGQNRLTSTVTILEREGWIRGIPLLNNKVPQSANLNSQGELGNDSLENDSLEADSFFSEDNSNSHQEDEIKAPSLETSQEENSPIHQKRSASDE